MLFRKSDNSLAALFDQCPHRGVPLSLGKSLGDEIQCGYHGLVFDATGSCTHAPTQPDEPIKAQVRSFPVTEKYGLIWIWLGDPDLADIRLVPEFYSDLNIDLGVRENPEHPHFEGYKQVMGDYRLMIDNLLDLSHIGFVHDSTIGSEESTRQHAFGRQETSERRVSDYRLAENVTAPPTFAGLVGNSDTPVDFWLDIHLFAPSTLVHLFGVTPTGQPRTAGAPFQGCHFLTPETKHSTHYFFDATCMMEGADKRIAQHLEQAAHQAFDEDLVIIEAQQNALSRVDQASAFNQPGSARPQAKVTLRADRATVMAQALIKRLIKNENAQNND